MNYEVFKTVVENAPNIKALRFDNGAHHEFPIVLREIKNLKRLTLKISLDKDQDKMEYQNLFLETLSNHLQNLEHLLIHSEFEKSIAI